LPHLAANDTIPLMDRSAVVAGDLSRLLANYDTSAAASMPPPAPRWPPCCRTWPPTTPFR
ncbi:hypothetical protein C7E18_23375, partial [Stenotrophomonas maltophilia]